MKKRIIAVISVVLAFLGIVLCSANVDAKTTLYKKYWLDAPKALANIDETTVKPSVTLIDENASASQLDLTIYDLNKNDVVTLNNAITTTSSINPANKTQTYNTGLKLKSDSSISFSIEGKWSIQLEYAVLKGDDNTYGSLGVYVDYESTPKTTFTGTEENVIYNSTILSGSSDSGLLEIKNYNGSVILFGALITVEYESDITATTYSQIGSKKTYTNNEITNTTYYVRFITIVDNVKGIDDLSSLQYYVTYNNKEYDVTTYAKGYDVIKDGDKILTEKIDSTDYEFSNKETTKYILFMLAFQDNTHTNYTGNLTVTIKLYGTTISENTITLEKQGQ